MNQHRKELISTFQRLKEMVPEFVKFNPYHGPDGRFTTASGAHGKRVKNFVKKKLVSQFMTSEIEKKQAQEQMEEILSTFNNKALDRLEGMDKLVVLSRKQHVQELYEHLIKEPADDALVGSYLEYTDGTYMILSGGHPPRISTKMAEDHDIPKEQVEANNAKAFRSKRGVMAHEIYHALDKKEQKYSGSEEWKSAWKEEIREKGGLSDYAKTNEIEGWAEFGRCMSGQGPGGRMRAARKFPKCYKYFIEQGLLK